MEYRPSKMQLFWIAVACIVAALAIGLGWDRQSMKIEPGYETDGWEQQLRSRTLKQGEAGRIY